MNEELQKIGQPVREVVIASSNPNKVSEIAKRLSCSEFSVRCIAEYGDPPTIAETAPNFVGNAYLKASGIAEWISGVTQDDVLRLVLADDSGLCVDALGGRPGVYSARFAGPDASDSQNNARMIDELRASGHDWSSAHYICVLVAAIVGAPRSDIGLDLSALDGDGQSNEVPYEIIVHPTAIVVAGRCEGEVGISAAGTGGFGYDPHFWVEQRTRTFAQMSWVEKMARSHRGRALAGLESVLSKKI